MSTLQQRRHQIAAKLDALKPPAAVEQAAAAVNEAMAAFRAEAGHLRAEIASLDAQLGVGEPLDPSIAANGRAQRQAAQQEREQRFARNWTALLDVEQARLQAIADAQEATWALHDAITRALACADRLPKLYRAVAPNADIPLTLNDKEAARRLGGRIAGVMQTLKGYRSGLGGLTWTGGDMYRQPDWAGDEERKMGRTLIEVGQKGKT